MMQPYGDQLEVSVLGARPMDLTRMLYDKLLFEIRKARGYLAGGEVRLRSSCVSRALEVVAELANSLDDERGGEVSRSLRRLYVYIVEQLNEGNARQNERCFANAELVTLLLVEAWRELAEQEANAEPAVLTRSEVEGSPELPAHRLGDREIAGSLSFSG